MLWQASLIFLCKVPPHQASSVNMWCTWSHVPAVSLWVDVARRPKSDVSLLWRTVLCSSESWRTWRNTPFVYCATGQHIACYHSRCWISTERKSVSACARIHVPNDLEWKANAATPLSCWFHWEHVVFSSLSCCLLLPVCMKWCTAFMTSSYCILYYPTELFIIVPMENEKSKKLFPLLKTAKLKLDVFDWCAPVPVYCGIFQKH